MSSKPLTEKFLRSIGFEDDPSDPLFLRLPLPNVEVYPTFLVTPKNQEAPNVGHEIVFTSYDGDDEDIVVITGRGAMKTEEDLMALLRVLRIDLPVPA